MIKPGAFLAILPAHQMQPGRQFSFLSLSCRHFIPTVFFVALLVPLFNQAQIALVNKGASIVVQQNALVNVQGDFTNDNNSTNGSVQNDGTIEIKGNFENKTGATFQVGSNASSKDRVVKFMGSGTQMIKGAMNTAGTSSFYNLVIDKAAATDTVEMDVPIVVEGSLVFGTLNTTTTYNPTTTYTNNNQKGLLKTFNGAGESLLDVQNGNPDAIAGYPILSINGMPYTGMILTSGLKTTAAGGLQRKISTATSYIFPVGTVSKGFNAVKLNFASIPGNGSVKMKFCDGSSNPDGHVGTLSRYCGNCANANTATADPGYNRYFTSDPCHNGVPQWVIFENTVKDHGYWSFASTNTGYHYDMEVYPNSFDSRLNPNSTWRVLKHEAAYNSDVSSASIDWRPEIESLTATASDLTTYTKNAGCYAGTGVPGGTYTDFSHFTISQNNSDNALPVQFLYVTAEAAGKHHIKVAWATAIEINNAGFQVMRSADGNDFTEVGWVPGHNNSTVNETYSFDDRTPSNNIDYYYKLKQIDNNQKFAYSNIVQAKLTDQESDFTLYPNPTANDLLLSCKNPSEEITVKLFDMKGGIVYNNLFPVETAGASQTVCIQLSSLLAPGTYVLNASTNGAQYKSKVVLQF